jgi:Tol biopolymer transport system component
VPPAQDWISNFRRTGIPGLIFLGLLVLAPATSLPGAGGAAIHPSYHVEGNVGEPRVFAEGIISTANDEAGGTFSPDGTEFYFTRLVPYTTLPRLGILCVSYYRNAQWSVPTVLPFSGQYTDYPPKFSPDGKRMFFASSRPLPDGTRGALRIWEVERTSSGWGVPSPLPPPINVSGSFWNADPSVGSDGTLYFSSDRGGGGSLHIYRSRFVDGKYTEPEKLGPEVNSEFNDYQPYISPDGKILIFSSVGSEVPPFDHRPGELSTGGKPYPRGDLYVSFYRNEKWTPARHLEHGINTFAEEQFPVLTPDGKYLFFSSERSSFTVPTARRLDHREMESQLHSIYNGHGNIFFISVEALEAP